MSDVVYSGARSTREGTVIGAPRRERPENFREGVLWSEERGQTPFTALMSAVPSSKLDDPQHNWFEEDRSAQRGPITTTITNVDTTLDSAILAPQVRADHLIMSEETGEVMRVVSSVAGVITVVRNYPAGGVGTAIPALGATVNPNFIIIGSLHEENSLKPTVIQYLGRPDYNYTQIFRTNVEVSRTMAQTKLRTEAARERQRKQSRLYHAQELERALWFGKRNGEEENSGVAPLGANGHPLRSLGGFIDHLTRYDAGVPATEDRIFAPADATDWTLGELDEFFYRTFLFGSDSKRAFCGNRAKMTMNQIARSASSGAYQLSSKGQDRFGLNISVFESPFGELELMTHPMFNQLRGTLTTGGAGYFGYEALLAVVDMADVEWLYIQDTDWFTDQQEDGQDGYTEGWLTEATIRLPHPRHHSMAFFAGTTVA